MKLLTALIALLFAASIASTRAADPKENWTKYCAQCHGPDGSANTPMGKKLNAKNLTDAKTQSGFTDAEAAKAIKEGVKENGKVAMKAFGDKLSDDDVQALVKYVRSLKK
jgi:mono/diheme cytochrome c family protein